MGDVAGLRGDVNILTNKINLLFLCNAPSVMAGVEKTSILLHKQINRERFQVRFILIGRGPFYEELKNIEADVEIFPETGRYSLSWKRKLEASLEN